MRGRNPPRDNREGTTRWRRIGRGRYNRPLPHCIPSRRVVPIHAKKNPRGTGGQSPPAYRRKHRQKPIDINQQRKSPDSITKLENRAIKYRARSHNLVLVREVILGRVSHKPSRQHRTGEPEVVFTQLKSRKTRFTLTSFLHLVLSVIRFRRR